MKKIFLIILTLVFVSSCAENITIVKEEDGTKIFSTKNNEYFKIVSIEMRANKNLIPPSIKKLKSRNVNEYGQSLFHIAVENNHLETIRYLIKEKYDIDKKDDFGSTPLSLSIKLKRTNLASLLIDSGANVSIEDSFNETALINTIVFKNETIMIKILRIKNLKIIPQEKEWITKYLAETDNSYLLRLISKFKD